MMEGSRRVIERISVTDERPAFCQKLQIKFSKFKVPHFVEEENRERSQFDQIYVFTLFYTYYLQI